MDIITDLQAAQSAINIGRKDIAITLLTKILETNETSGEAWYLLGQVVDDSEKKKTCFDNAQRLHYAPDTSVTFIDPNIQSKISETQERSTSTQLPASTVGGITKVVLWLMNFVFAIPPAIMFLTGIFGGFAIYDASSNTELGKKIAISENTEYKYICNNVYRIFGADFSRKQCSFVIHLEEGEEGSYRYNAVKDEYINELGLQPTITWWKRNGWPVSLILSAVSIFFGLIGGFRIFDPVRRLTDSDQ